MERITKHIVCFIAIILLGIKHVFPQAGVDWQLLGNNGTNPIIHFVGTRDVQPLQFGTNNTFPQMILNTNGFVGIGNFTGIYPASLLHLYDPNAGAVNLRVTNLSTGSTNMDGFTVGLFSNIAQFRQYENAPFSFLSIDPISNTWRERVNISHVPKTNYPTYEPTRVTISQNGAPITNPTSLLHIGYDLGISVGTRDWMDVGMTSGAGSDFMYVGLKDESGDTPPISDFNDAIIGWGDNKNLPDNFNDLRFIFTTPSNFGGQSGTPEGLEIARMSWDGNVGIGNFYNTTVSNIIRPQRRLEILNDPSQGTFIPQFRLTAVQNMSVNAGINTDFQCTGRGNLIVNTRSDGRVRYTGIGNFNVLGVEPVRRLEILDMNEEAPQLRLTFTPDPQVNNGIWTDFQTTSRGDLFIHPSAAAQDRYVGINELSPGNTLEINSGITAPLGTRQPAGLRFTNLNTNSQPQPTSWPINNRCVLSVDDNGDVVLVNDVGGGSVNSNCATADIVARFDNTGNLLQCSDIYNNAASPNNRIGLFTTDPRLKFQCESTAFFTINHVTPATANYGLYHPNSAVIIDSKNNEALSILHSGNSGNKDLFRIYGDDNTQYHLRIKGTTTGSAISNSVTFDHEDNGTNVSSWMAYNALQHITLFKDDFNTNPFPNTNLGFNYLNASAASSKVYVEAQTPVGYANNNMNFGLTAGNTNTQVNTTVYAGILGYCNGSRGAGAANIGGMFYAKGAHTKNYAVQGIASSLDNTGGGVENVAGYFLTNINGDNNKGLYCESLGGTATNYGIYAKVNSSICQNTPIGQPPMCSSAAGFFNGAVYTTEDYYQTSDSTLKQNITAVYQTDTLLKNISVYSFTYDTLNAYDINLEKGTHYGLISQQVQQVFPSMVKSFIQPEQYDSSGNVIIQQKNILALNYSEFIPLLIAGYKHQSTINDSLIQNIQTLQSRLDSLIIAVANCCNAPMLNQNPNGNEKSIELENTPPAIILNQNDPNPFAENTTITWSIPPQGNQTFNAMLVFYNTDGRILKTVKINETGNGTLLVYGSKLSSGIYSYSLVVNGKTIETKRMMKLK